MFVTSLILALAVQVGSTYTDEPGKPIVLTWYHNGQHGAKFRVWQDGRIIVNLTSEHLEIVPADLAQCPESSSCFQYTTKPNAIAPIVQPGTYVFQVSAYNEFGEVKSEPTTLVVKWLSAPPMPRGLMFVRVELLPDGTWRIVK